MITRDYVRHDWISDKTIENDVVVPVRLQVNLMTLTEHENALALKGQPPLTAEEIAWRYGGGPRPLKYELPIRWVPGMTLAEFGL